MSWYKTGLLVGRFQPFHIGHYSVLERALAECEKVIVILGSAQESRVPHNPLTSAERQSLIEASFPYDKNRLIFIPVKDRSTVVNDKSWGEYLFDIIMQNGYALPEVVYEGKEAIRTHWYDTLTIDVVQLSRTTLPISGTQLREMLLTDNNSWRAYCPWGVESYYENLKEILEDVTKNRSSN